MKEFIFYLESLRDQLDFEAPNGGVSSPKSPGKAGGRVGYSRGLLCLGEPCCGYVVESQVHRAGWVTAETFCTWGSPAVAMGLNLKSTQNPLEQAEEP